MTINDMRRIFREEMRLAGLKKVGSITWMIKFDEISWVYSLTKDRYGNRMTLLIGVDIKSLSHETRPTNYIGCPVWGDVLAFQPSIGLDFRSISDLFDAEVDFDEDQREAEQRRVYKTMAKFSSERSTLASIQELLNDRQHPRVAIKLAAQPLIRGSR